LTRGQNICAHTVKQFTSLAALLEEQSDATFENDRERISRLAFDSYVNRPLVGNSPVRKTCYRSPVDAVRSMIKITNEVDWAMCDLVLRGTSLARVHRILDRVQQSNVNILTRSLILLNLFFDEKLLGQYDLKQMIVEHMQQWMFVPDEFIAYEYCQHFLNRLAKPIYDTLKVKALNRCRQRVYMEAAMIPDWVSLQLEGRTVDIAYRKERNPDPSMPPFISQYVLSNLIRIMDRHVAVALELGLFCGYQDICTALWYRDYILSTLLSTLTAMRNSKAAALEQHHTSGPSKHQGKSKRKGGHKSKLAKEQADLPQHGPMENEAMEDDFEFILIKLKRDLCRGTKLFIAALELATILRPKKLEFTNQSKVFDERFGAFATIVTPPLITYEDFLESSDASGASPDDLLLTISTSFQVCKKSAEHLIHNLTSLDSRYSPAQDAELRSLLKVALGNSIYAMKLKSAQAANEECKLKVTFKFEGASQFCTLKLV
jgi:hypothetical protein